jgi:hypothetical protein
MNKTAKNVGLFKCRPSEQFTTNKNQTVINCTGFYRAMGGYVGSVPPCYVRSLGSNP